MSFIKKLFGSKGGKKDVENHIKESPDHEQGYEEDDYSRRDLPNDCVDFDMGTNYYPKKESAMEARDFAPKHNFVETDEFSWKYTSKEVLAWISRLTKKNVKNFTNLKDGTVCCELINAIKSKSVKKISYSDMQMNHRENINNFLEAAGQFGVQATFKPEDVSSFAKRDRVLRVFAELNNNLKGNQKRFKFKGPFIEKIQVQKSGWTGGLLQRKDHEIKTEVVNHGHIYY